MKEEIILNVLRDDTSSFAHWPDDDRKRLAGTIARILDAVETFELDLKRKTASAEILSKLELVKEIGTLQDKLKKVSWHKFSERRSIKFEILEL